MDAVPEFTPGAVPQSRRACGLMMSFKTTFVCCWLIQFLLRTALGHLLLFPQAGVFSWNEPPALTRCPLLAPAVSASFSGPVTIPQGSVSRAVGGKLNLSVYCQHLQLLVRSVLMDFTPSRPSSACTDASTSREKAATTGQYLHWHYSV